jgi:hypothetical protein
MSDTTTAAGRFLAGVSGRLAGRRRVPPLAAPVVLVGLLAGGLGIVAPGPAAPASATVGAVVFAAPSCPKVIAPATPRPRAGHPAPPGGRLVRPVAARGATAGSRSGRPALIAGPGSPPRSRCHPPPANPDVVVPEPAAPAPVPGRGARPPKVVEPDRRQPRRQVADRPAPKPRRAVPATAAPAPLPARANGYGGGVFPADESGLGAMYRRSLIYSGLFGLALASVGMAMVGRRRRRW